MHVIRIIVGSALALALSGISIGCCFLFGRHLAPGDEGLIYGTLGGVADAMKSLLPLAIVAAVSAGQRGRAAIGIILFAVFSTYSFASEMGLYSLSRDAQSSTATAGREAYAELKTERARVQDRLAALGQLRPSRAIAAELTGQFQSRLWESSSKCQEASATASRAFCAGIARLQGELAASEEAEALRAKDGELGRKIGAVNLADALKSADPQSEALARLTGLSPATIKDGLAILVALLIELGSGFGLYAVTGKPDRPIQEEAPAAARKPTVTACSNHPAKISGPAPSQETDAVRAFAKAVIVAKQGREVAAGDLHAAFIRWAELQGRDALSPAALGRKLTALKYQRVKRGGNVFYRGVDIAPGMRPN